MNPIFTTALEHSFKSGNALSRSSQTLNLQSNGILLDVEFKPVSGETASVEILKDVNLSLNLRIPNANSLLFLDTCRLFDLLSYSDFVAGVSMESLDFVASTANRISGFVDLGYFKVPEGGALDMTLSGAIPSWGELSVKITFVNYGVSSQRLFGYSSVGASGGDQSYRNALAIFNIGHANSTQEISYRDEITSGSVSIKDCTGFANATGRFEFFTDFGVVWSDAFKLSQNISIKAPVQIDSSNVRLLIKSEFFRPDLGFNADSDIYNDLQRLVGNIKANDNEKYQSLVLASRL